MPNYRNTEMLIYRMLLLFRTGEVPQPAGGGARAGPRGESEIVYFSMTFFSRGSNVYT